MKGKQQEINNT